MSTDQDQARLIAERVARRVAGTGGQPSGPRSSTTQTKNGAPVSEELSAIREGLHDLENKLDRIESKIVHRTNQPAEPARARLIDFVSSGPPVAVSPSITSPPSISQPPQVSSRAPREPAQFVPATHSP